MLGLLKIKPAVKNLHAGAMERVLCDPAPYAARLARRIGQRGLNIPSNRSTRHVDLCLAITKRIMKTNDIWLPGAKEFPMAILSGILRPRRMGRRQCTHGCNHPRTEATASASCLLIQLYAQRYA
jgi:hypothetical protein